jgi:hypothetical protein
MLNENQPNVNFSFCLHPFPSPHLVDVDGQEGGDGVEKDLTGHK